MRSLAGYCVPLVAIGAQDLAFRDLGLQPAHRSAGTDHFTDISGLQGRIDMVEFQDHWIFLPAMSAGMLQQELMHKARGGFAQSGLLEPVAFDVRNFVRT
jgi:hypothetical protein